MTFWLLLLCNKIIFQNLGLSFLHDFLRWAIPGLFFYLLFFSIQLQLVDKNLRMLGFEPRISGARSNHSTNRATPNFMLPSCLAANANEANRKSRSSGSFQFQKASDVSFKLNHWRLLTDIDVSIQRFKRLRWCTDLLHLALSHRQ